MLDFVYVVTFEYTNEYETEFEVVGAARTYDEAKELILEIIKTLPPKYSVFEERKDENNYYISGTKVFSNRIFVSWDDTLKWHEAFK